MPVTISLLRLVELAGSRPLWPVQFEALIQKLEEKPAVKAQWGVIADWCQENDEPELANTFRWVHHQPKVTCVQQAGDVRWSFRSLPKSVEDSYVSDNRDTIPAAVANLYAMLEKARDKAKKQLEELA